MVPARDHDTIFRARVSNFFSEGRELRNQGIRRLICRLDQRTALAAGFGTLPTGQMRGTNSIHCAKP